MPFYKFLRDEPQYGLEARDMPDGLLARPAFIASATISCLGNNTSSPVSEQSCSTSSTARD